MCNLVATSKLRDLRQYSGTDRVGDCPINKCFLVTILENVIHDLSRLGYPRNRNISIVHQRPTSLLKIETHNTLKARMTAITPPRPMSTAEPVGVDTQFEHRVVAARTFFVCGWVDMAVSYTHLTLPTILRV